MSLNLNNIWVEKYRPHKFSDMILSEKNRQLFKSFEAKHDIPHLLFCSKPGMGKTTAAKIIVNDILQCQYIYINASDTNGIDTVRNEITNFAQTKSWDGNFKVIILDEFDGFTNNAQKALRNIMEEYAKYRKEKQPIEYPSAGSTFKRGNDFITAKLIDEAGLKGYCVGDAEVSTKHSGFVINKGNATAKDVLQLVNEIQRQIKQKFSKEIELEIEIIGKN